MQVLSVAVPTIAGGPFSGTLDIRSMTAGGTYSFSLDPDCTSSDQVTIYGTFNSAATDASDATTIQTIVGGKIYPLTGLYYPYLIVERIADSGAGATNLSICAEASAGSTNPSTLNLPNLALGDLAAGSIGSAATTVDVYSSFTVAPTVAARAYTFPDPTNQAAGRFIQFANAGTQYCTVYGQRLDPSTSARFMWDGTTPWSPSNSISQGGNVFGAAMTIQTLDAQNISITSGAAVAITSTTASAVTVNSGTTGDVNLGTGAAGADGSAKTVRLGTDVGLGAVTKTILIGGQGAGSSVQIDAGTGNIDIGISASGRQTNIATGAAAQLVTVGSTNGASSVTVNSGTAGISLIGTGAGGVTMTPGATGRVTLAPRGAGAGDTSRLAFLELAANGTDAVTFQAPDALAASVNYTLPDAAPTINGQSLVCTTAGVMSWSGAVNVRARNTNAQVITDTAAAAAITTWTEVTDTAAAFDAAAGTFTVPVTGFYAISAQVQYAATAANIGATFELSVAIGGTATSTNAFVQPVNALAQTRTVTVTAYVQLTAAQVVDIRTRLNGAGGNIALTATAEYNTLSIAKIG